MSDGLIGFAQQATGTTATSSTGGTQPLTNPPPTTADELAQLLASLPQGGANAGAPITPPTQSVTYAPSGGGNNPALLIIGLLIIGVAGFFIFQQMKKRQGQRGE